MFRLHLPYFSPLLFWSESDRFSETHFTSSTSRSAWAFVDDTFCGWNDSFGSGQIVKITKWFKVVLRCRKVSRD